jgi:hypothetical protein
MYGAAHGAYLGLDGVRFIRERVGYELGVINAGARIAQHVDTRAVLFVQACGVSESVILERERSASLYIPESRFSAGLEYVERAHRFD